MGLFFAFLLIGLPAAALLYDFRNGGDNPMLARVTPQGAAPQKAMITDHE